jgi:hypothetical protein
MEEHPGPPLNHVARGAVVGLFRASKNQNHIFSLAIVRARSEFENLLAIGITYCQQKCIQNTD